MWSIPASWPREPYETWTTAQGSATGTAYHGRSPWKGKGLGRGHELHRLDDALLDAEPGVLHAAERRTFHPEPRDLIDVDRAGFQFLNHTDGSRHVVGHHAGGQAKVG